MLPQPPRRRPKLKISRILPALPLALLAAASALAKPTVPAGGGAADSWRAAAVRVCVANLADNGGPRGDQVEFACGCAADQFLHRRPGGAPPPLAPQDVRVLDANDLFACAAQRSPALAAQVEERVTEIAAQYGASRPIPSSPAAAPPAQADDAKPGDAAVPAPAPAEAPKRSDAESGSPFDTLSLPAWLTDSGLPTWALVVLAFLVLMVLRGLLRRDDRRDLVAPPSSMRRIASPKPMAQRPPPRS